MFENIEQLSKIFYKEAQIKSILMDKDLFVLLNDMIFGTKHKSEMISILIKNDIFPKKVNDNIYLLFKTNGVIYRNVILDSYGGYFIRYKDPIEVKKLYDSLEFKNFVNNQEAYALWSDRVE
jgi:hypothetical protein